MATSLHPTLQEEFSITPDTPHPTALHDRISSMDIIRGVAVLGILIMNIFAFGLPEVLDNNPALLSGNIKLNETFWFVVLAFFSGSMRGLFSMLFGASVILLTASRETQNSRLSVADIYYRRLLWLFAFGMADAYLLLWFGDILYAYAICGLFLFPFRNLKPGYLLLAGFLCFAVLGYKVYVRDTTFLKKKEVATAALNQQAQHKKLTEEQEAAIKEYRETQKKFEPANLKKEAEKDMAKVAGGYTSNFNRAAGFSEKSQTTFFYHFGFLDIIAMMFVGMAFFRLGILSGRLKNKYYLLMLVGGYSLGLVLGIYPVNIIQQNEYNPLLFVEKLLAVSPINPYQMRRLLIATGHIGLIMLIYKMRLLPWLMNALSAVGRMAFTNYVIQTVICSLVFYGFGFNLFGKLPLYELYYVVAAVWGFQLIVSPLWLRYFRFGPLEWLWRSLSYWQRQPMLKEPPQPEEKLIAVGA
ncbi:hypothetical protein AAE02nite_14260 [Adhaeribacter aerolatus]|uniref:DUF418 domain-containing protein n=1 Tax=Adhaeribacter aerolatus TaxID=670289 RepID=A0A512AVM5_9BACT|nr:DUF418 domain-containing protein [Adhaeribacter aerolatus]GEO03762.1 hypothetical protein AAE02nite_14260 [Adhaeribacter aerolatus]